jgi:CelD/BcsL family acetyltransferase involved in cellulose biosynthesis
MSDNLARKLPAMSTEGGVAAAVPALAIDRGSLRAVVLPSPRALREYAAQWAALADAAAEANVFYEPWVLGPALATFGHRHDLSIVLVLADPAGAAAGGAAPLLLGLFPLERKAPQGDLPLPHLQLWMHDYLYVPVPLVHRDFGKEVLGTFFDWLATQTIAPALLSIEKLPVGGPFHQLLVAELDRRNGNGSRQGHAHVHVHDRYVRAVLAPRCDAETYQQRALGGKHRKEFRRRKKRLGETGALAFRAIAPGAAVDIDGFIASFLALEASGWKGESGSALASRGRDARFFAEMISACHRAGRLQATTMDVAGKPLAMQILLCSGGTLYAFKMAYDEAYARYSPGVLLVLDLVERTAADPEPRFIDSAADRDHPMVNQLFTERRNVESLVVGVGSGTSLLLALLPALRWAKRALTRAVRRRKADLGPVISPNSPGGSDASTPAISVVQAS